MLSLIMFLRCDCVSICRVSVSLVCGGVIYDQICLSVLQVKGNNLVKCIRRARAHTHTHKPHTWKKKLFSSPFLYLPFFSLSLSSTHPSRAENVGCASPAVFCAELPLIARQACAVAIKETRVSPRVCSLFSISFDAGKKKREKAFLRVFEESFRCIRREGEGGRARKGGKERERLDSNKDRKEGGRKRDKQKKRQINKKERANNSIKKRPTSP